MRSFKALSLLVLLSGSVLAFDSHAWGLFGKEEKKAEPTQEDVRRKAQEERAVWLKSMHEQLGKAAVGTPFKVELREDAVVLSTRVEGAFNPDRPAMLLSSMLPSLSRLAKLIAAEPAATVVVLGQADKPDPVPAPQGLATERARSVASILRLSGMGMDRLRSRGVVFDPGQKELDSKGRVASRRVELLLVHRDRFASQLLSYKQ